jgi:hypothetical protein
MNEKPPESGQGNANRKIPEIEELIERQVEEKLGKLVNEAVARQEERRFRRTMLVLGVISVIGVAVLALIAELYVGKLVLEAVDARAGQITETLELRRINALATKLDLKGQFSTDDKDAAMAFFRSIADNEDIKSSADFMPTLNDVLKSFISAQQTESVDEIFGLYRSELLHSNSAVEVLLHHYGQEIVGRSVVPKDDRALDIFEQLERVASARNVPELAIYYRTLFEYKCDTTHPSGVVLNLLDRALSLSDRDLTYYCRNLLQHTRAENWQKSPTPQGREIERVTRAFLTAYAEELANRCRVESEFFRTLGKEGIEGFLVETAAEMLVESARGAKE